MWTRNIAIPLFTVPPKLTPTDFLRLKYQPTGNRFNNYEEVKSAEKYLGTKKYPKEYDEAHAEMAELFTKDDTYPILVIYDGENFLSYTLTGKETKKGTKPKQAIAIGLSVERQRKKKKGSKHQSAHRKK